MRPAAKRIAIFALGVVAVIGAARLFRSDADPAAEPRTILGRVWFDHLPKSATDDVTIGIWLGGGIGIYDTGSVFRSSIDVFEFERRGNTIDAVFLHDKKKATSQFQITKCDDKPPFDLCITFDDPARGPKKLYAFGDESDAAARIPWSRDMLRGAEAKAAAARR